MGFAIIILEVINIYRKVKISKNILVGIIFSGILVICLAAFNIYLFMYSAEIYNLM